MQARVMAVIESSGALMPGLGFLIGGSRHARRPARCFPGGGRGRRRRRGSGGAAGGDATRPAGDREVKRASFW